ncbi:DUF4828 domain-containing protein [Lactiplantibacillus plantarum]|uniref:DUF4828 domain-containing protein n=1 Tax=Lactiplantibacillus plantarum TaxID=1590 RepID=UPI00342AB07D
MIKFISWIRNIIFKLTSSKQNNPIPTIFIGNWRYLGKNNKEHKVTITDNLELIIDSHSISKNVILTESNRLVFLDAFGFEITFFTNRSSYLFLIDEADDEQYLLTKLH